ncbi:MAG TPA: hypothetical protein VM032_13365 [Vicinamibacterales bacterium]|nr:hypothetical protein [Vicinamibacterales bacterium]
MNNLSRRVLVSMGAILLLRAGPTVQAQEPTAARAQVVSANPFGLLLGLFNAEYERKVSASASAGVGGSSFVGGDDEYLNADAFYRFYPSGRPLDGFAFGVKAGMTNIRHTGTYVGVGFDTNWSWLLGQNDHFYVGAGFGLKRLFGVGATDTNLEFIPTVRIINVGIAF